MKSTKQKYQSMNVADLQKALLSLSASMVQAMSTRHEDPKANAQIYHLRNQKAVISTFLNQKSKLTK
ncbi:MAG: hypothetical protein WCO78_02300 [Candidatus Roizmanbacteria bacterium]